MLAVSIKNNSYTAAETVHGILRAPGGRWATTLSPDEVGLVGMMTARNMKLLGYERGSARRNHGYVLEQHLLVPFHIARAFAANRRRISNLGEYVVSRAFGGRER